MPVAHLLLAIWLTILLISTTCSARSPIQRGAQSLRGSRKARLPWANSLGLSMGGAEATFVGLNHLDKFAWIGSFSGAYVMWPGARGAPGAAAPPAPPAEAGRAGRGGPSTIDAAAMPKNFPALDAKANSQIRLLWIACGTADGLVGVNRQFRDWLSTKDVKLTYIEVPDMAHVLS